MDYFAAVHEGADQLMDWAAERGDVIEEKDWETAFGKVDQTELVHALGRLNMPLRYSRIL